MQHDPFGFPIPHDGPAMGGDERIEVEWMMIGDYEVTLAQMMENAGRWACHFGAGGIWAIRRGSGPSY